MSPISRGRLTWRFTHLGLQEYFFAQALLKRMTAEVDLSSPESAQETMALHITDKLFNGWFREPLLVLASCAEPNLLRAMVECILADADNTGASEMLALNLLDECLDSENSALDAVEIREESMRR